MERGEICEWHGDRALARGLAHVAYGDLVVAGGVRALVTALHEDRVELAPLAWRDVAIGAEVRALGPLVLASGRRVLPRDPYVSSVQARRITLGLPAIDLQRVFATGVALAVTGSPRIWHHAFAHQHAEGRTVIAVTFATLPVDATPTSRWLVPWLALAEADELRASGRDVVVMIDDLEAWRPGVLARPERGAWPTQLLQLASRAFAPITVIARCTRVSRSIEAAFDAIVALDAPPRLQKHVTPPLRVPSGAALGMLCARAAQGDARARDVLAFRPGMPASVVEQLACVLACMAAPELAPSAIRVDSALAARLRAARAITEEDVQELVAAARRAW